MTKEDAKIHSGGCTSEIKTYLSKVASQTESELIKTVLGKGYAPNGNATYLTHVTDDKIDNLLIYKNKRIYNRDYSDIVYMDLSDIDVAEAMVDLSYGNNNGTFANNVVKDTVGYTALKNKKFKLCGEVFGIPIGALMHKCHPDAKLKAIRYSKRNIAHYQRLFIELLTEHDTMMATNLNEVYCRTVYQTGLKSSNAYRVKMWHFTKALTYSDNWYSFLLFVDDEPIGFVKGKVDKETKTCFPDLYLRKGYFEKYATAAYSVLLEILFKAYVRYIGTGSIYHNRDNVIITRLFGRSLAVNMFKPE